jgi:predicted ester cyclase
MRRWLVWPLSILLAVATGAALSDAVAVIQAPLPAVVQTQDAAAVRAFYAAANAVLRTGDASALAAAVPADFVDHADLPGATPDRAGLGRYLAALHDAAPGAQLTVADLTAVGDRALARVVVVGAEEGTFLGVPLAGPVPVWGQVDAFRVGGRRVRERWGEGEGLLGLAALGRLPLGARLPPLRVRYLSGSPCGRAIEWQGRRWSRA